MSTIVPPLPPPPAAAVPLQASHQVLPQIQGQAQIPILTKAVDPSARNARGKETGGAREKLRGAERDRPKDGRGGSVNIKV